MSSRRQISIPLGGRYRQVSLYMAQYFNLSVVETGIIREMKSLPWLLMLRLLASPSHQQLWYWLCMVSESLSFMRTGFNYMSHLNVDEWNVNTMFLFLFIKSTHLPLDKMAAISQTIFSDTLSWMKVLYFDQDFTELCFWGSNWQ